MLDVVVEVSELMPETLMFGCSRHRELRHLAYSRNGKLLMSALLMSQT